MSIRSTLLFLGNLFFIGSCTTADKERDDSQLSTLDIKPYLNRLDAGNVKFPVLANGQNSLKEELCILPRYFPGGDYKKSDLADDKELCSYNFYSSLPGQKVYLCPKLVNTNPGIDIHASSLDISESSFQNQECRKLRNRATKKLAKYKHTITCAYSGSIIGYYHLGRILGDIGNIPNSVLRTMDLSKHAEFTRNLAVPYSRGKGVIEKTWNEWSNFHNGRKNTLRDYVLTSEYRQLFGALSENPRGEINHPIYDVKTYSSFIANPWVARVFYDSGVGGAVKRDFKSAVYGIKTLKDISDMIVIDFIMAQQDRLENFHAVNYYYYRDALDKIKRKKASKVDNPALLGMEHVLVPRLILKDNDCGVRRRSNLFAKMGTLEKVRHMPPKTYKRVLWAAREWSHGLRDFLREETGMSQINFWGNSIDNVIGPNLRAAAATLKANCESGRLLLDLDVDAHIAELNTDRNQLKLLCSDDFNGAVTP